MKRTFGNFARILIDIDLKSQLRDQIMVEREDYAFLVKIEYERVSLFCKFCQTIGHDLSNCKVNNQKIQKDKAVADKEPKNDVHQYVPKQVNKGMDKPRSMDKGINNVPVEKLNVQDRINPLLGFINDHDAEGFPLGGQNSGNIGKGSPSTHPCTIGLKLKALMPPENTSDQTVVNNFVAVGLKMPPENAIMDQSMVNGNFNLVFSGTSQDRVQKYLSLHNNNWARMVEEEESAETSSLVCESQLRDAET